MNLIQKQRIKYTVTVTITSAIFLFVVFGCMFGLVGAVGAAYLKSNSDKALSSPLTYNASASQAMRCLYVYEKNGIITTNESSFQETSVDIQQVVDAALTTEHGRFSVDNRYYIVNHAEYNGGTLYAIFDRTASHEQFVSTTVIVVLLYVISIVLVVLLALMSSARLLYPVTLAMSKQRDFVANTSHELKTPLTIISTNIDVIKSEPSSTVQDNEKWISSIETQIERMHELISSMLELSKLEQAELKKTPLNFSSVVEGACLSFEAICFEKNIEFIIDLKENISLVGDEKSLERLVIILLDNATKYCGEKGKIGIKLSADTKKAYLTVVNTGETISKEDAEHIFDRFYRTDGARKNEDNHSFGLGLSIASATVKAHGGLITCKGIEGKGTQFDVVLPLQQKKQRKNKLFLN